jgi:hypothetical protein
VWGLAKRRAGGGQLLPAATGSSHLDEGGLDYVTQRIQTGIELSVDPAQVTMPRGTSSMHQRQREIESLLQFHAASRARERSSGAHHLAQRHRSPLAALGAADGDPSASGDSQLYTQHSRDPAAGEGQYYNIRSGFWASEGSTGAADTPLSPPHRLDQPGRPR